MGEHPARSVAAELERLREDYVRRLPARLTQLREQADAALEKPERESIESVRESAHRFKGSSGSHHLAEIAREMSVAEQACETLLREHSDREADRSLRGAGCELREAGCSLREALRRAEALAASAARS